MNQKNNMRIALAALPLLALLGEPPAQALPMGIVDFTPGNGHFEFSFAGSSEFTGSSCVSCALTDFSMTDLFGKAWSSSGVGNGGVTSFSLSFDALGQVFQWSIGLGGYPVPCPSNIGQPACHGEVMPSIVTQTTFSQTASYAWKGTPGEPPECFIDDTGQEVCTPGRPGTQGGEEERAARARIQYTAKAVPEPGSAALLGLALAGFAAARRRLG